MVSTVLPLPIRAGRYLLQATGYRAFVPGQLPRDPPLNISTDLQALLSAADRALGRLDGSIQTLPHRDLVLFMYVRKDAVLTSHIHDTQSSLVTTHEAEPQEL